MRATDAYKINMRFDLRTEYCSFSEEGEVFLRVYNAVDNQKFSISRARNRNTKNIVVLIISEVTIRAADPFYTQTHVITRPLLRRITGLNSFTPLKPGNTDLIDKNLFIYLKKIRVPRSQPKPANNIGG